jgi:thiol-disulfide isomerase/thioredoxin
MMRMSLPTALVLGFGWATGVSAAPAIGEKAPEIKVAKWVTKEPPALPGKPGADKYVFLIDFGATWLPEAREHAAHLVQLQEQYEKEGLVVIGVDNEEAEDVEKFVQKAMKSPYYLGVDDDVATATAWIEDMDIPCAFVVDRSGIIVWRGNSETEADVMDKAVEQTLAGKIDVKALKEAAETNEKFNKLMNDLRLAYGMKEKEKVFKLLDEMLALKPKELEPYMIKREALRNFDLKEKIADWDVKIMEAFRGDAETLRRLVSIELGKDIAERDPELLVQAVMRLNELSKGQEPGDLLLLARVQGDMGQLGAAIATQTEAVEKAPAKAKDYYRKVLEYYQAAEKLGKELKRPTPTSGKA